MEEAMESYNKAISINPDSIEAYISLARVFLNQHQYNEAWNACNRARELNPNSADVFISRANILYGQCRNRNYKEANEALNTASRLSEFYGKAYSKLGLDLFEQGSLSEALRVFLANSKIVSKWMFTYYRYAVINPENEEIIQEGIKVCNLAIEANFMRTHAYFTLAFISGHKNDHSNVIVTLEKLMQINDKFPGACFNLARALRIQKFPERSLQMYRSAIELNPQDSAAYHNHWNSFK